MERECADGHSTTATSEWICCRLRAANERRAPDDMGRREPITAPSLLTTAWRPSTKEQNSQFKSRRRRREKSVLVATVCLFVVMSILERSSLSLSHILPVAEAAGGDCMAQGETECFECNSFDDPRCHDPFNYTIRDDDMPEIKMCEGCCVKLVQFIGTEHYQVRRTCTDDFEVNYFIVNHACMIEGHRHGHMCFCETDRCNDANKRSALSIGIAVAVSIAMIMSSLNTS